MAATRALTGLSQQIWAVRSGSGGPDLTVPFRAKDLIAPVENRSDGSDGKIHTSPAEVTGDGEEDGAGARAWTLWSPRDLPRLEEATTRCSETRRRRWASCRRLILPGMARRRARSGGGGGDFSVDVDSVLFGDKQNETGSQRDAHGKRKEKERDKRVRGGLTVTETRGT